MQCFKDCPTLEVFADNRICLHNLRRRAEMRKLRSLKFKDTYDEDFAAFRDKRTAQHLRDIKKGLRELTSVLTTFIDVLNVFSNVLSRLEQDNGGRYTSESWKDPHIQRFDINDTGHYDDEKVNDEA